MIITGNIDRYYKISNAKSKNLLVEDLRYIYNDILELTIKERIEKYKLKPGR